MSTNVENLTPTTQQVEEQSNSALLALTTKQARFVTLYMTGQYTLNKLSQLLEVHVNTLGNWLKREDVKLAVADIQSGVHDQVQVELKMLTLKATQKLAELMSSPIDGVALQAVKDVLDRAGHKQKTEIKIDKTVTNIEQRFQQLIDSTIIDADYVEVHDE
jgi:phage terminase small subunit